MPCVGGLVMVTKLGLGLVSITSVFGDDAYIVNFVFNKIMK